jgi:hypothetical protein
MLIPLFPQGTNYVVIFRGIISRKHSNLIELIGAVFEKIAFLYCGIHLKAPILGAGMFIFAGHHSRMSKLFNAESEKNPFISLGAHPYMYMHVHIQTVHKRNFFVFIGLKMCNPLEISR